METFQYNTITITLNTVIDISAYSTFRILYKAPDGSRGYWTGAQYNTNYVRATGCKPLQVGVYRVQAFASGGGNVLHGKYEDLEVLKPLNYTTTAPTTPPPDI